MLNIHFGRIRKATRLIMYKIQLYTNKNHLIVRGSYVSSSVTNKIWGTDALKRYSFEMYKAIRADGNISYNNIFDTDLKPTGILSVLSLYVETILSVRDTERFYRQNSIFKTISYN